jgi:Leucine-rich repeat (LRR) protein
VRDSAAGVAGRRACCLSARAFAHVATPRSVLVPCVPTHRPAWTCALVLVCAVPQSLCLRSHLIKSMRGVEAVPTITQLEVHDNSIRALQSLEGLTRLTVLDASYNRIKKIECLDSCRSLVSVYLASNRIETIEGLDACPSLTQLDLGDNKIRVRCRPLLAVSSFHSCV